MFGGVSIQPGAVAQRALHKERIVDLDSGSVGGFQVVMRGVIQVIQGILVQYLVSDAL